MAGRARMTTLSNDIGKSPGVSWQRVSQGRGPASTQLWRPVSWVCSRSKIEGGLYIRGTRDRQGRQGPGHVGPLQAGASLMVFILIALERMQLKPLQDFKWELAVI